MSLHSAIIHETAIIHGSARIGHGVVIGPNVWIGPDVVVAAYAVIGGMPEHRAFADGPTSQPGVIVDEGARIYEFATIHAGTKTPTRIKKNAMVFNHSHVGHDCEVGVDAVVGGQCSLAGHTVMFQGATVSGKSCTHQFAVLGAYSFLGAASYLKGNVPPGNLWLGNPARSAGMNVVGLERAGLTEFDCKWKFGEEFELATTRRKA